MEHTLGGRLNNQLAIFDLGLNPCFNGTYSRSIYAYQFIKLFNESLNPCFNGTYSRSKLVNVEVVSSKKS